VDETELAAELDDEVWEVDVTDEPELADELDDEVWDVDDTDDTELLEARVVSKYSSSLFPAPQYS
jgi:hypothetical protein